MKRLLPLVLAVSFGFATTACSTGVEITEETDSSGATSTSEDRDFPGLGEEVSAGGATIVIHDLARVPEMEMCPEDYACGSRPNEIHQPDDGGEFLILNSTVTNNSKEPMDLTCSLPIDTGVLNKKEQTYSTIDSLYNVPGNPECNEQLQPGFDAEMKWVYMIPTGTELDYFVFQEFNMEDAFDQDNSAEIGYIDLSHATPLTSVPQESASPSESADIPAAPESDYETPAQSAAVTPTQQAPAPTPATPAPVAPPVIGHTEAPGVAPPSAMNKSIQSCGDPSIHETGTTFFTDGTSGWTQQCANQMGY